MVVSLQVECLGHLLGGRVELERVRIVVAPSHGLTDLCVPINSVAGSDHQVPHREHHRVVALLDVRLHPTDDAVPDHVALGPLAVFMFEVVVPVLVGLAVAVPVVLDLALPLVTVVGAVLERHVIVVHLPLHTVVGQGEWGDRFLARPHEHGSIVYGWPLVGEVAGVIPDSDEDISFAVVRENLQLGRNRVVL